MKYLTEKIIIQYYHFVQPELEYQLKNFDPQLRHFDQFFPALNFQIIYTIHNFIRRHH